MNPFKLLTDPVKIKEPDITAVLVLKVVEINDPVNMTVLDRG